ncbi:MAG: glycosyltransferase family 4 protein [bacterium]
MKILIPYCSGNAGGPTVFVTALTQHLQNQGYKVISHFSPSFDVLLVIAECPLLPVLCAKLLRKRIVQRLDGVYHAALPGATKYLYPLKNLRMQIIHNFLADHVIYQSRFSKYSCQTMLGKRTKNTSIIYNGVAAGKTLGFDRKKPRVEEAAANLVTYASFRRPDQIEPILESVKCLTTPYHLHIYGPHTKNLVNIFNSLKNNPHITYYGAQNHSKLLSLIPQHDIFLFSDQSACPNAVLEALAAGLPVVAFNRGSIPELIQPGASGEIINYPFTSQNYTQFAQAIQKTFSNLSDYQTAARQRARINYDVTNTCLKYEKILRQK